MVWSLEFLFILSSVACFPGLGFLWGPCLAAVSVALFFEAASVFYEAKLLSPFIMVDSVSVLMGILTAVVLAISFACSVKDFQEGERSGIDSALSATSAISFFFFFFSGWIGLYFLFEASLIPTLWLILKWGYQPERTSAGMYMILYAGGASLPLFLFIIWASEACKGDSVMLWKLSESDFMEYGVPGWISILVLMGFLVKLPVFGFHGWLPKAHVEAPLGGSMILAGVLLKLGGFGMIRMMWCLSMHPSETLIVISALGLWGGLLSTLVSAMSSDVKLMIAYSSVSHMSFVLVSLASCVPLGKVGAQWMMVAHGLVSPCMFALAAASYDFSSSRSVGLNKGLMQVETMFSLFWFVFALGNFSAPPSLNFYSEVVMVVSFMGMGEHIVTPVALMIYGSCVFNIFLFSYINHGSVSGAIKSKSAISERYLSSFLLVSIFIFFSFLCLDAFI
uniref:NADH-ubiquinone oxidoreductase chain 4 n=1 Tax=Raeta sp. TaxID=3067663 RepID=A0AA49X6G8_9BIVA|nr:NADH dehydrogenase subunit 4 [Raeta sp.]